MKKSDQIDELVKALCAFQAELPSIRRDGVNPFHSSAYATFDHIVKIAAPLLSKQGLAVSQPMETLENGDVILNTMLMHASGQYMGSEVKLLLDKRNMQGLGSAITYARRYSYSSVLGLVTDVDDDGNEAVKPGNPKGGKSVAEPKNKPAPTSSRPSVPDEKEGPQMASAQQISQLSTYWAAMMLTDENKAEAFKFLKAPNAKKFGDLTQEQAETLITMMKAKQEKLQKEDEAKAAASAQKADTTPEDKPEPKREDEEEDVPYYSLKDVPWLVEIEEKVTPFLVQWKWIEPGQTLKDLPSEKIRLMKKAPERVFRSMQMKMPEGLKGGAN